MCIAKLHRICLRLAVLHAALALAAAGRAAVGLDRHPSQQLNSSAIELANVTSAECRTCGDIWQSHLLLYSETDRISAVQLDSGDIGNVTTVASIRPPGISNIVSLAYDPVRQVIIFSDLYVAPFLFQIQPDGSNFKPLLRDDELRTIESVTLDPDERIVYYTESNYKTINSVNLKDLSEKIVIRLDRNSKPRSIVLYKCEELLFWTNWNENSPSIEKYSIAKREKVVIVEEQLTRPNGLTIDSGNGRLYWIHVSIDKFYTIESCDFNGNERQLLLRQQPDQHPFSLIYLNSHLYWSDWNHYMITSLNLDNNKLSFLSKKLLKKPMGLTHTGASNFTCQLHLNASLSTERHSKADEQTIFNKLWSSWLFVLGTCVILVAIATSLIFTFTRKSLRGYFRRKTFSDANLIEGSKEDCSQPQKSDEFSVKICGKTRSANRNRSRKELKATKKVEGATVCIEDLGGFNNQGYYTDVSSCNACPIRKTCDFCDYKDECIEKGICLSTYGLLSKK